MDAHVKALGVIYIILGIFTALGGLALFGILAGAGLIADDRVAALTTGLIGTVLGGFLIVISLPNIVAGIGLLKRRAWARVLAIILGVIHLVGFPIGTAIGVYTLYVLLNDRTTPRFARA